MAVILPDPKPVVLHDRQKDLPSSRPLPEPARLQFPPSLARGVAAAAAAAGVTGSPLRQVYPVVSCLVLFHLRKTQDTRLYVRAHTIRTKTRERYPHVRAAVVCALLGEVAGHQPTLTEPNTIPSRLEEQATARHQERAAKKISINGLPSYICTYATKPTLHMKSRGGSGTPVQPQPPTPQRAFPQLFIPLSSHLRTYVDYRQCFATIGAADTRSSQSGAAAKEHSSK